MSSMHHPRLSTITGLDCCTGLVNWTDHSHFGAHNFFLHMLMHMCFRYVPEVFLTCMCINIIPPPPTPNLIDLPNQLPFIYICMEERPQHCIVFCGFKLATIAFSGPSLALGASHFLASQERVSF